MTLRYGLIFRLIGDMNSCNKEEEEAMEELCKMCESIKNCVDKLPSLVVLENIRLLVDTLIPKVNNTAAINVDEWLIDLRIIIRRLLQTRNIDYIIACLSLSASIIELIDWHWFATDPQFCLLIAIHTNVEIRDLLDVAPSDVDTKTLTMCCNLAEKSIEYVENDQLDLDEQLATKLSCTCRENAQYLSEYLIVGARDGIVFTSHLLAPIYQLLCRFIAIGGDTIIDQSTLIHLTPILKSISTAEISSTQSMIDNLHICLPYTESL